MDPTEQTRREQVAEINANPGSREALEEQHGQVWSTEEMRAEFAALGFLAPFIMVQRNSDGKKGTLEFQHSPRFYYGWQEG